MELRDFAERVLFATTLEEKLRGPESITDEQPGRAVEAPTMPGRPPELGFKPAGATAGEFPGLHRLEQAGERGRLLHFFANNELLATELMALVLLRFPDAPAAFRRGVLQTLRDEQEHTRLYLARMAACGIRFGEMPVSGYFWRSVAPMESPLDFVAGLSLTFEQANLDYARHFSHSLATVGDADSAALLDRIYRDEIGHVAHGLKWFRRWKQPGASDWEAYCRQLKFPLSPQRAKGVSLNVDGRRVAGLDPGFIAELDAYSASKGRTPGVFLFNPFAEGFIAHGPHYTPTKFQAMLARDLANLPQFLARQGDVVLVPQRPAVEFLSGLKQAGFTLPELVDLKAIPELARRKLGRLRPWAWGPDSVEVLAPLFTNVTDAVRPAAECFNAGIASLYSKAWSAAFLGQVLQSLPAEPWLSPPAEVGVAVHSYDEALAAIAAIRGRGHHRVVVKEAFGLAGSNALRLWEYELLEAQQRWLAGAGALGRQLVVEPWLQRVVDFSVQLEMEAGGLRLIGYSGLRTDQRGQFMANWAEPEFARRLPGQVLACFKEDPAACRQLPRFYPELLPRLETELRRLGYLGPLGIDAFVYRDADGHHRLKPVVEINPRYTMGRLTLELMRQVAPGSYGRFRIRSRTRTRAEGATDLPAFAKVMAERHPVRLEGQPVGKIREGVVCLTNPEAAQWYLATFEVGSRSLVT
ncbi:MAG TPA: DUF455 family protein [Candidatus Limnocylindria bacterium]|nr:DUF455 family protein [Candidatus Limnocylindria bacterium]